MAHLQYMPGDPRLVDQLVYELKSKGIFDQFRKECIADVDTRPAYQNLRQRVESSVAMFLSRQCWKPDLNKNQLREKLRKHILDGNYLEQGVERIVDQVVNPKVASVFIPQVEDLVYNYLGITRKKSTPVAETSNGKTEDLLPTDLEAVSPGSVKSNDDKEESMELDEKEDSKMETDEEKPKAEEHDDSSAVIEIQEKQKVEDTHMSEISDVASHESDVSIDKSTIPLPAEEIKLENIPPPENSPPKIELENIELPKEPNLSTDIPLPDEIPKLDDKEHFFKPINSEDDDSSSDSSLRRNMSPLTPIRNFNNENSCDAQQAFENDSEDSKAGEKKEPNTFRFTIESKSSENSSDETKIEKKDAEQSTLSYQFNNQVNINVFNTPLYEDSSNSNNLQIDYESDANSKLTNAENKGPEAENSEEFKKEQKTEEKKSSSHKGSHRSRDSHRHSSSSKDRRSNSKHSSSRDRKDSKHDKKSTKDDHKSKSSHSERSRDRSDKKDSRDSLKHRSSHKNSSHKDSKSHRSSSSSQRHSSKHSEEKKTSSSSQRDKSEKSSREHKSSRDSKHSSHRSDRDKDKDRKSSSSKAKQEEKDKEKKDKKETDDHYSLSGRGNNGRRSTDRDSNDGSSSSKGSHNRTSSKTSDSKKDSKGTSSKSENTSTGSDTPSPSDKDYVHEINNEHSNTIQPKPIIRVETHLETPISTPPNLPFVPDVTLKKPKFAANLEEAKKLMKMRKFLDEEQKRMNQEAALLLEFQANVRPSLSQVYSSISGPELEFACVTNTITPTEQVAMENNHVIIVDGNQIIYENNTTPPVDNVGMNEKHFINEEYRSETINDIIDEIEHPTNTQTSEDVIETCEAGLQKNEISDDRNSDNIKVVPGEGQTYHNSLNNDEQRYSMEGVKEINNSDNKAVNNGIIIENESDYVESFTKKSKREVMEIILGNMSEFEENGDVTTTLPKETCDDTLEQNIDDNSDVNVKNQEFDRESVQTVEEIDESKKRTKLFEITIITEEISENEDTGDVTEHKEELNEEHSEMTPEKPLEFFAEYEKYKAELERDEFSKFLKDFIEKTLTEKLYLINCDTYEENIIKEVSEKCGTFEVVNNYKNGHLMLKANSKTNIVKNVNVATELTLPIDQSNNETDETKSDSNPLVFSPVKSECSFELSSDYDAKLEEMVNKTSRQEIMEIILGGVIEESPSKMPKIDYCMDSNIEVDTDINPLKRKLNQTDCLENNNKKILTPKKIRKLSDSDQISSTTEDGDEKPDSTNKVSINIRSKYLGKARRIGLPKPRKSNLPNSPSSDKSVENYEDNVNTPKTPNGKIKTSPRIKVQRYDKSELYKPKLHYLSRRNMNN